MISIIDHHLDGIKQICRESDISYLAVFGSHARGDFDQSSDVDLLVEFNQTPGLKKFIGIKHKFEDLLETQVDLVTRKGLSKHIEPYIRSDIKQIYG